MAKLIRSLNFNLSDIKISRILATKPSMNRNHTGFHNIQQVNINRSRKQFQGTLTGPACSIRSSKIHNDHCRSVTEFVF